MLDKIQLEQFSRDGYTVYPNYLSSATVQSLLEKVEQITDGNTLENHDSDRMEMEPDGSSSHMEPSSSEYIKMSFNCTELISPTMPETDAFQEA